MALLRVHKAGPAAIPLRAARRPPREQAARRQLKSEGTIDCGCWHFLARMLIWAMRNGKPR